MADNALDVRGAIHRADVSPAVGSIGAEFLARLSLVDTARMLPLACVSARDVVTTEDDRASLSSEVKRLEGEVGTHAHHPLLHLPVFEQLKQRNVFRVAILYLVVCWLVLDPVHVVFHMLDVPVWANRLVVMLMAAGFPAVVIFAWVYEITPEGLKPTVEVPHHQSIRKVTGRRLDRAIIAVLAVALAYFIADKFWISKRLLATRPSAPAAEATAQRVIPAAAFAPPPHSIAVLPFVNISGEKEQEYFSDGLSEELLNSLSRIPQLQVAAHTSSFYFKGKDTDLGTIARKLNVAAVLEGSVRKSSNTVRITAQLVNAATGFHLWSKAYDRDLGDVLKIQSEIADAIASALQITLLGGAAEKVQLGGTRNPAAFDAYLRGLRLARITAEPATPVPVACRAPIEAFSEAIERDPNYALAYARRALVRWDCTSYSADWLQPAVARAVRADAQRAIELAPGLPEGLVAISNLEQGLLNLATADQACTRALTLAPNNDQVLSYCSGLAASFGRADPGVTLARRCVAVDPLNPLSYQALGYALMSTRRNSEAVAAYQDSIALDPRHADYAYAKLGVSYYLTGNLSEARTSCEVRPDYFYSLVCKAIIYHKLGRRGDASAAMARAVERAGDAAWYQYAQIYAQWNERQAALVSLEKAMRLHDPGLLQLKTDPLMDPLRKEPRFQAVMRELKFPQ
jgi:TolB-like protein